MRLLLKSGRLTLLGAAALAIPAAAGAAPLDAPPPESMAAPPQDSSARELEAIIDAVRTKVDLAQPDPSGARRQERLAASQERLQALDQELAGLRQEVTRLRQQLIDADIAGRAAAARQDELARRLRNAEHTSERLAQALDRADKARRYAVTERDRVVAATGDELRLVEASTAESRQAATDEAASALAQVAELQARLDSAMQDLARQNLLLAERDRQLAELQGGQGKDRKARELAEQEHAELRQQLDQLTAERDKARVEAAAAVAVIEAKLAEAGRQLETMGEEVRQAWADRAAAEERLEEQAGTQVRALAAADQALAAEHTARQREVERLRTELGQARTRAAAMDGVSQEVGRHADELARELTDMRNVASSSVAQADELGQQLVETLAELDALRQFVVRLEAADPGALPVADDPDGAGVWPMVASARAEEVAYGGDALDLADEATAPSQLSVPVLARLSGLKLEETVDGWLRTVPDGIEFELGGRLLGEGSARGLERVATLIQLSPGARVKVVGHTDVQGDRYRNLSLSMERARALRNALTEQFEIDPARIEVDGMGPDEPIASNDTASGRSANRRVEVFVAR